MIEFDSQCECEQAWLCTGTLLACLLLHGVIIVLNRFAVPRAWALGLVASYALFTIVGALIASNVIAWSP